MQKTMQQDQPDPEAQILQKQHRVSQQQALRFIYAQLIATFVLSAIWLIFNSTQAYSSLAGGLTATLANAWFAIKVFRVKPTASPETLLSTLYVGEIYKFVLTGAMFVIVFVLIKPLSIVALLVTYFFVHITPAIVNTFGRDEDTES